MTRLQAEPRDVLGDPVTLVVESDEGEAFPWETGDVTFVKEAPGAVAWETTMTAGPVTAELHATLEFDGCLEYTIALRAQWTTILGDVRLEIPYAKDVARYMLGLGQRGGRRPPEYDWTWDVEKNQDSAWLGDVNAGLQFTLKDENYQRPLNTNFYHLKPLVLPTSWHNEGRGGIRFTEKAGQPLRVHCYSGERTLHKGETLCFNVRLLLTPFRPIEPAEHFATRFFHRYAPPDEIEAAGANVVNVHHGTPINPYINYPFLRPEKMKAYIDAAHARDLKVKIYYTVRELANRAPELFALRSLGDEILADGPGGGATWLQEHLVDHYIGGWYVYEYQDAAVINSGTSRWHNYYVEGLDWLARNLGLDGLYIDDLAFDRVVMQRIRKVLDRRRDGALIDLHSANQFNERDGFANSANLYMEHFPYVDRLWFGEYFDYDADPEYWMTEVSGIPFGLMGEMLEGGGNPWRGMLYGMTGRLPWAGDPRPIWQLWDDFGITESEMLGYWAPTCPVQTDHERVLATAYVRPDRTLIALASWAADPADVRLDIDWDALGVDPATAQLTTPAVEDLQTADTCAPEAPLTIDPGGGRWLIVARQT
jgi:hypothetical protein